MEDGYGRMGRNTARGTRWKPSRQVLRVRLHALLVVTDVCAILLGALLAMSVSPSHSGDQSLVIGSAMLPIYLGAAFIAGAYSVHVLRDRAGGVGRALQSFALAVGAVVFVAFYLKTSASFSRLTFSFGALASMVLLGVTRAWILRHACTIIGGNPVSVVLISEDGMLPPKGEFPIVLTSSAFDLDDGNPQMYDRLGKALGNVDRVVVRCKPERRMAWVHVLQGANVEAEIIAPELAAMVPKGVGRYADLPTLVVARGPLSAADRLTKRAFDLLLAGAGLFVLAPLFVLVILAITATSRGGAFFVQTRIGRGNRLFKMLKFRSMRKDAGDEAGHASTGRDDDRITRVGRFIRMTSIDELPQLLNVLKGDMSIVGPRPHALGSRAEDKLFWEIDERYWHRHAAKPGLTGLAQVRGYRGATEMRDDLVNRLQADLEYLNGWTIWRDIQIILMTVRVLVHRNAF